MIQSHLYTNQKETGLFSEPGAMVNVLCYLDQGTWLGELDRKDGWVHVIGIRGDGWVRVSDVETRSPFNLHIHFTPGKPIEYVSTAA